MQRFSETWKEANEFTFSGLFLCSNCRNKRMINVEKSKSNSRYSFTGYTYVKVANAGKLTTKKKRQGNPTFLKLFSQMEMPKQIYRNI